jgi:hypothetical protein
MEHTVQVAAPFEFGSPLPKPLSPNNQAKDTPLQRACQNLPYLRLVIEFPAPSRARHLAAMLDSIPTYSYQRPALEGAPARLGSVGLSSSRLFRQRAESK